jgi:predicted esterase
LGTPVLLSSSDPDPDVPWKRVQETARELTAMGAIVHTQRCPGRPHTILPEELQAARSLLEPVFTCRQIDSGESYLSCPMIEKIQDAG